MFASFASLSVIQEAKAQTDSLYLYLDTLNFVSESHSLMIKGSGAERVSIDVESMQNLPRILGNTDPISFLRLLPGVQTASEYDSGLHIQGSDNAHNEISVYGVPVFNVSHLFGFFSVFNPSHYDGMTFSNTSMNRLGGSVEMSLPDTLSRKVDASIDVGMMSSQASVGIKMGKHLDLRVSARQSYMNLLYKRWLKIDNSPVEYSFGDYNLTLIYDNEDRDRIYADMYFGQDAAHISSFQFGAGLSDRWSNRLGAIHWQHEGDEIKQKHSLHVSNYVSSAKVLQMDAYLDLNSSITSAGYQSELYWKELVAGAGVTYYDIMPQHPRIVGTFNASTPDEEFQRAFEINVNSSYAKDLSHDWIVEGKVKGNLYISPERKCFWGIDPHLSVGYNAYSCGRIRLSCGLRHQYLFQTGYSNIGLPVNFWFAAGRYSEPQTSQYIDLSYELDFARDAYALSADLYFKRLDNQVEFAGDIFDLFNSAYDLDNQLLKGDGYNFGLNLQLRKQSGDFTGWVSYSLGRALRRFDNQGYSGYYPASHERIHELNVAGMYQLGRWNLSSTFVYASGAPFTPPEYYYLTAGQILTDFAEFNSCRMRPYVRLDLSATFRLVKDRWWENGINVSLYNVLCRDNDVMYRLRLSNNDIYYSSMSFFLRLVPSVSYYHKF